MNVLENKIPPPIVTLVFAFLIWWLSLMFPVIDVNFTLRIIIAAIIFTLGLFFCVAGVVSFRRAKTTVNPLKPEGASSLVISGVYRISRNPMYVGFAFFLLSLVAYLSSPFSVVGVIGFILYMNKFQIKPEENALEKIFTIEFSLYKEQVRRWL
ncbi:MAG: isoprenylcysteine carboxylmethyltransferase family protein [Cellvibrionaceae bacterium]